MNNKIEKRFIDFKNSFSKLLTEIDDNINYLNIYEVYGRVTTAVGTMVYANIPNVKIGDLCLIFDDKISLKLHAEVVAIENIVVKLLPFGNISSVSQSCLVKKINNGFTIKLGNFLLGKSIDSFGEITGNIAQEVNTQEVDKNIYKPIMALAPDPLSRPIVSEQLITGVKSIDLFVSCGRGQRIGIFATAGVGKTTLMGMIIRNAEVDVVIVALVGERGREVREFIDIELTAEIKKKCVLVIATSDRPPVEQVKCAYVAQTIAEYFRDQGKNVLLFTDSITRFARAQREVGLSAGEPVARGGYPPSVFLSFPKLMERAGNSHLGSITAFYTVLIEDEQLTADPIADEIKSILDGHIILSKKLSERSHFPSINILNSLSRVADRIIDKYHLQYARHIRLLLSKYEELEFLIRIGEYKQGQDKIADEAVTKHNKIMQFLQQTPHEKKNFQQELKTLKSLAN